MTPSRTRAILSSTVLFSALSFLPKVLAIAKDMVVALRFGAAQTLDVYLMAFVLIGVPVSIIVVAIQTTLIPALVNKDVNTAAGLLGGAIKLVAGLLALALPAWLVLFPIAFGLLNPGNAEVSGNGRLLVACLWLIPYYFSNGVNLLLYGALQSRKVFWPNAVLPGLFPLAILVAVWLKPEADIRSLLLGTVVGSVLEGFMLFVILRRAGLLRLRQTSGSALVPVVRLALPLMAGGLIASLSPLIEQLIAVRLGAGAVSLLSYGNKAPAALNSILLTAIGIVVLPHFAELLAQQQWRSCRALYLRLSAIALGVGILVAAGAAVVAEPIIHLLFVRGAFTATDGISAAAVMSVYLMQLPFVLVAMVSMRALVAMGCTQTMTWITSIQLMLAAGLAYSFSIQHGVVGVAAGTAVASLCGATFFCAAVWYWFDQHSRNMPT